MEWRPRQIKITETLTPLILFDIELLSLDPVYCRD